MKNAWKDKSQRKFCLNGYGRHLHNARLRRIKLAINLISFSSGGLPITLIDLGCGEGVITSNIASERVKVVGTDCLFEHVLSAAKSSQMDEKFIASDILKPIFKKEIADIVLLHHVLEHFDDGIDLILESCHRMLKKNGYLILGVPNEDSLMGRLSRKIHPKLYANGEHVRFYTEKSIVDFVKSKGFNPVSTYRIGFLFPIYYVHIALISCKVTFLFGDFITRFFQSTADSLIILCKKE